MRRTIVLLLLSAVFLAACGAPSRAPADAPVVEPPAGGEATGVVTVYRSPT